MRILSFSIVAGAALLTAACSTREPPPPRAEMAPPPPMAAQSRPEGKDCFWLSQVNGFTNAGRHQVDVHTGPSEVYRFEIMGSCPDLPYTEDMGFDQHGPGQICRGVDVTLIVPTAAGPRRCPVRMIHKLSPAEMHAQ
ncbi:MAG: hypothetical protein GC201_15065 [Alphaproteobacteria bacterium]|nr:hypothetical protein [Alphaproteobacteria bacterium]